MYKYSRVWMAAPKAISHLGRFTMASAPLLNLLLHITAPADMTLLLALPLLLHQ